MWANFHGKEMPMKFWWNLGPNDKEQENDSEKYECIVDPAKLNEDKTFDIVFRDFGLQPIKISADDSITIMQQVNSDENFKQLYGNGGNNFKNLPDQDHLFDIEHSRRDNNCTDRDTGQFPCILYS